MWKKERRCSILLAVALLLQLFCGPTAAAAAPGLSCGSAGTEAGNEISVPVSVSGNPGVMGFGIAVRYDAQNLTAVSVTRGSALGASGMLNDSISETTAGAFKVVWTNDEEIRTDGELFWITFRTSDEAMGEYSIDISVEQEDTFNEAYEDVSFSCTPAVITVSNEEKAKRAVVYSDVSSAVAGQNVDIPVYIRNNSGFQRISLVLEYDPEVFSPVEVKSELSGIWTDDLEEASGILRLEYEGKQTVAGDTVLAVVRLKTAAFTEGEYPIILTVTQPDGVDTEPLRITVVNPEASAPARVCVDTISGRPGETIDIPVYIENNHGIMGFRLDMVYDENLVTPVGIAPGEVTAEGTLDASEDFRQIIWASDRDSRKQGTLFVLSCRINPEAKTGGYTAASISFRENDTFNEKWEPVKLECSPVRIEVKNVLTGSVTAVMNNGTAKLTAAAEGGSGTYSFCFLIYNEDTGRTAVLRPDSLSPEAHWTYAGVGMRIVRVKITDTDGNSCLAECTAGK